LRQVREEPYTQKEAEAAIGLRTDNGKQAGLAEAAVEGEEMQSEGAQHREKGAV
jgi:bud site selection protein 20